MRIEIKPELLRWARQRAGLAPGALESRFPKLKAWEHGASKPTLKQLENFAKAARVPVGFLFLSEPPVETTPIHDFRTAGGARGRRPSPDLLDTIYICQERQVWFRDHAATVGERELAFVGSASRSTSAEAVAAKIREELHIGLEERQKMATWTEALRRLIEQAETAGILVMCSGVVLNNNHRQLDPSEFRGFTLADTIAPLIFINGSDSKAAQMFTLAHELAHVWLGQSGVGDEEMTRASADSTERWCDHVAAEVLAPIAEVERLYRSGSDLNHEINRLARHFKVSSLVALRRVYDLGKLSRQQFRHAYDRELEKIRAAPTQSGGDFYLTQGARVGKRFARALIESTADGRTLYRDALRLLGFTKLSTLHELGLSLWVSV